MSDAEITTIACGNSDVEFIAMRNRMLDCVQIIKDMYAKAENIKQEDRKWATRAQSQSTSAL